MKAILLCAGKGTRLKPYTNTIPKCLMLIKNKPLLEIWLENLNNSGVDEFLINTHHLSQKVDKFILSNRYKDNITTAYEEELLGTAGTLISNLTFYGENDGILIHADNYCLEDMASFIKSHNERPKNCQITLMSFRTTNPSSCGILEIDSNNIVQKIHEKVTNPPGNLANGAVYIISKDIFNYLKKYYKNANEFTTEILKDFEGKIYSHETSKKFIDIGTEENYLSVL